MTLFHLTLFVVTIFVHGKQSLRHSMVVNVPWFKHILFITKR